MECMEDMDLKISMIKEEKNNGKSIFNKLNNQVNIKIEMMLLNSK